MKKIFIIIFSLVISLSLSAQGLKDAIGKYFLIGAAVNVFQSDGKDEAATRIIRSNFNSIVAENCMKSGNLQPNEGEFYWKDADRFVKYAEENHQTAIGHCLVWHSQAPRWFFRDKDGNTVSKEVLIDRIHKHIAAVVGRYKGKIHGWDVVNEAFEDNGSMRRSPFYNIIGPDFIELAFKFAHEADPDAELYYNDYSMSTPSKREAVCRMIRKLKADGCRIDAIGMQSHNGLDYPNLNDYETSIDSFAACGVKVMMTELDLNVLPSPDRFSGANVSDRFKYREALNPYKEGLPDSVQQQFDNRYAALFNIYYKHRNQISRVTLWGISDAGSWLNGWPIPGRTNYPLLFDRQYQPKPIVEKIIKIFK